jgi:creatinine amidohydrolase
MLLEEITMEEFRQALSRGCRSVIVPFGSIEEHGPHLPLGTDTLHAVALAKMAAELAGVFAAPPVWYGLCRSTSQHPGTLSIKAATLALLVKDLVRSLYGQGLQNFVMLSGHAGGTHMSSILNACDELMEELPEARFAVLSIIDLIRLLPEGMVETPGDSHAGEVETSLIQYLYLGLVKGEAQVEFPRFPRFIIARNKLRFWPGGIWGDPSKASASKGEEILVREAHLLKDLISELENFRED